MMRTLRSIAALSAAAALAACAGAGSPRPDPVAAGALYGDVLASHYADLRQDPQAAFARARMAQARAPNDLALAERALSVALAAGDQGGAVEMAARVAALDPAQASARLVLAADAIRRERWQVALGHLEQADGGPLERMLGLGLEASALAGRGRLDDALAALDRERGPLGRLLDPQRGLLRLRAGDVAGALAAFESAEQAGVRMPALLVLQGDARAALGRADEAAALYRATLERFDSPEIAAALARLEAGQVAPARSTAQDAALGVFSLAMVLVGRSDDRAIAPYLALALLLDPGLDAALISFAEGLEGEAGAALSIATLERVSPQSPYFELARAQIAWRLAEIGRTEEALAAAAAAGDGRFAQATHADLLRSLGRFAEAEAIYDALIGSIETPVRRDWRLFFARGATQERQGRWAQAEADLQRALELAPDEPEALNYLGYGWVDRGERLDEALAMLRRAVALRPDSGHIIDSLGWAYYRLGRYDEALPHLERAVELAPNDPTINDHLGDVYWALGRRIEARFQWSKALTMQPDAAAEAAIKQKLAQRAPASGPPVAEVE